MGQETKRVQSQNDTQIAINRENIKHQKEENALDREFQANQWQREFDQQSAFQRQFWKEQFEAENSFNSPTAQVARLQAAGINPAALVSNISGVASAAASPSTSAPSPSSPSGGHGVSGSIPSALPMSTDAALFSSLAQLNDSLNNAAKVGLQANEQNVMLDRMARNMAADTENKQAATRSLNLDTSIKQVFGNKKASADIQKLVAEAKELETKGDLNGSLMKYYNVLETAVSQENAYKKEAYPVMLEQLQTEIENIKSQIAENKASVGKLSSETTYQNYENELKKIETDVYKGVISDKDAYNALKQGVLSRIKADAAAAGKDKIVNEIEEYEKSRLDPRNQSGAKVHLNDTFNRVRTWLKGIRN